MPTPIKDARGDAKQRRTITEGRIPRSSSCCTSPLRSIRPQRSKEVCTMGAAVNDPAQCAALANAPLRARLCVRPPIHRGRSVAYA
jgi:hypothetical protein